MGCCYLVFGTYLEKLYALTVWVVGCYGKGCDCDWGVCKGGLEGLSCRVDDAC